MWVLAKDIPSTEDWAETKQRPLNLHMIPAWRDSVWKHLKQLTVCNRTRAGTAALPNPHKHIRWDDLVNYRIQRTLRSLSAEESNRKWRFRRPGCLGHLANCLVWHLPSTEKNPPSYSWHIYTMAIYRWHSGCHISIYKAFFCINSAVRNRFL